MYPSAVLDRHASASEALDAARGGLSWIAASDATELTSAERAEVLVGLTAIDAVRAAASAAVLGAFNAAEDYAVDGARGPRPWLMGRGRMTKGDTSTSGGGVAGAGLPPADGGSAGGSLPSGSGPLAGGSLPAGGELLAGGVLSGVLPGSITSGSDDGRGELLLADAVRLLSGPTGLGSWLRGQAGYPAASVSLPLDIGRATDTIPTGIRRAVAIRAGHCRWPGGCDLVPDRCQVHHVVHRARGDHEPCASVWLPPPAGDPPARVDAAAARRRLHQRDQPRRQPGAAQPRPHRRGLTSIPGRPALLLAGRAGPARDATRHRRNADARGNGTRSCEHAAKRPGAASRRRQGRGTGTSA